MRRTVFLILILLSVFSACKKSEIIYPEPETPTEFKITKDLTSFDVITACWLSGDVSKFQDLYSKAAFQDGASNIVADLVVTETRDIETNAEYLDCVYEDGGVILILEPDLKQLGELMSKNNWDQVIPAEGEDVLIYAFCRNGAYALNRIGEKIVVNEKDVVDVPFEQDDDKEDVSDDIDSLFSDGDSYEDPAKDIDFTELGYYIAPFTRWVNENVGLTSSIDESSADFKKSFQHQYTYNCDLYVYRCSRGSDEDRIKGNLPIVARYDIQPYYIYPGQVNTAGDYYMVKANYSCEMDIPGGVFQGHDRVKEHGKINVHICGAYLRNLNVKTFVDTGSKDYGFAFLADGTPKPTTDINTVNYSHTTEHSVSAGVSGGGGKTWGSTDQKSWRLEGNLHYGWKHSNSISYSVRDLTVKNVSSSVRATAAWKFICNNLPKPKHQSEFSGKVPYIACSTVLLDASWIWHADSDEWGVKSLGKITTEFSGTLGACCNGWAVWSKIRSYDLSAKKISSELIVPNRLPFGTMSFDNRFKGDTVVTNISVVYKGNHGKQEEIFKSTGHFSQTNPCVCNLPEGPYEVKLDVVDVNGKSKTFKSKRQISVARRRSETDIQHCTVSNAFFEEVK